MHGTGERVTTSWSGYKPPGMIVMTNTYLRGTDFRDPLGDGEFLALVVKPTKHNVDHMILNLQEWVRQLEDFKLSMS